eukprot:CAMPEP_0194513356 /NCGR_PEP_ID=MMETSP0253-20130528/45601_1 /TAXON_ID=2966 /ORGANISM="Noctiluca scintillans" /LENGTH=43 /DNA_ID= /DNA_START= /DNA_END= /DNA_ORIENTATION=
MAIHTWRIHTGTSIRSALLHMRNSLPENENGPRTKHFPFEAPT